MEYLVCKRGIFSVYRENWLYNLMIYFYVFYADFDIFDSRTKRNLYLSKRERDREGTRAAIAVPHAAAPSTHVRHTMLPRRICVSSNLGFVGWVMERN